MRAVCQAVAESQAHSSRTDHISGNHFAEAREAPDASSSYTIAGLAITTHPFELLKSLSASKDLGNFSPHPPHLAATMNIPDVPIPVEVDPNEDTEWYVALASTQAAC